MFWTRAEDGDGYDDLTYVMVTMWSLENTAHVVQFNMENNINGYFFKQRAYTIQCGTAVDVEYVVHDRDRNDYVYTLYWN